MDLYYLLRLICPTTKEYCGNTNGFERTLKSNPAVRGYRWVIVFFQVLQSPGGFHIMIARLLELWWKTLICTLQYIHKISVYNLYSTLPEQFYRQSFPLQ